MDRYLREPQERPAYRGARTHQDFVGALPFAPAELREMIRAAFDVAEPAQTATPEEIAEMEELARSKYVTEAWIHRR
jgi:lipoate-protein ligase A